jgi:class 3 adenylate cyclase
MMHPLHPPAPLTTAPSVCATHCSAPSPPCSPSCLPSLLLGPPQHVQPHRVMSFLNELFSALDDLVAVHCVHKVETAGDCYIVSAGVVEAREDGFLHVLGAHDHAASAAKVMAFAKAALRAAERVGWGVQGVRCGVVRQRAGSGAAYRLGPDAAGRLSIKAPPGPRMPTHAWGPRMHDARRCACPTTASPARCASACTAAPSPAAWWAAGS